MLEGRAGRPSRREGRNLDLSAREGADGEKTLPTVLQPSLYVPQFRNLPIRKTAMGIAKHLLGPSTDFERDHAIYKPSHRGG